MASLLKWRLQIEAESACGFVEARPCAWRQVCLMSVAPRTLGVAHARRLRVVDSGAQLACFSLWKVARSTANELKWSFLGEFCSDFDAGCSAEKRSLRASIWWSVQWFWSLNELAVTFFIFKVSPLYQVWLYVVKSPKAVVGFVVFIIWWIAGYALVDIHW